MNGDRKIRILIADDSQIFRNGICSTLEGYEKIAVISECSTGIEAFEKCKELKPDIAVLDIEMPGMNGLEVLKAINREISCTNTVILTGYKEDAYFEEAFENNVTGYLLKDCLEDELIKCLEYVAEGENYISPAVSSYFMKIQHNKRKSAVQPASFDSLTPTEKSILKLIAENKTNKQIADELFNSIRTIETHRNNICTKLGLKGHNALLLFSLKNKVLL
ncbi:MAG: DNA-binding response regulator [Ignavibacteriae bacterium]|nr:MAG: DNA-binding response regulator [Ignavibacteriota bacterium]